MQYRYAPDRDDSDLASGRVLRSSPGYPAFPVRLGLELLHRARAQLPAGAPAPTLWDPCCGTAQLVTALAMRARRHLAGVVASDIDPDALELARRNLRLLTLDGLDERRRELSALADTHGKRSHLDAAEAAGRLHAELAAAGGDVPVELAPLDALDPAAVRAAVAGWATVPDIVLADVPHGRLTAWHATAPDEPHAATDEAAAARIGRLVTTLAAALPPTSVIVVVGRARRIHLPPATSARQRLRVGHRAAAILRAGDVHDT